MKHTIFVCEDCKGKSEGKFNGEHWLPPKGWIEFYCPHAAITLGMHLCKKCVEKAAFRKNGRSKKAPRK